jgi:hypothetical protein
MKRESDLVKHLTRQIEGAGGFVAKYHGGRFARAGVPDLHVDHPIWSGWIECKFGDGKATELQQLTLDRIERAGGSAFILRSDVGRGQGIDIIRQGVVLMHISGASAEGLLEALRVLRARFAQ